MALFEHGCLDLAYRLIDVIFLQGTEWSLADETFDFFK